MKEPTKMLRIFVRGIIATAFLGVVLTSQVMADEPHDVRTGMTIEEATGVAIKCIQAASRMKAKDIRLQDTLTFVGINDEMRLDALRRHLVRNRRIGVQSKTRKVGKDELPFIILNKDLLGIDPDASVAKLATLIAGKAGIPRLTYERVSGLVTGCRENKTELKATTVIADDLILEAVRETFIKCMVSKNVDKERKRILSGVPSAGVKDPDGRYRPYSIDADILRQNIVPGGWTYAILITNIAEYATVPGLFPKSKETHSK